jgi:hypothetical protein
VHRVVAVVVAAGDAGPKNVSGTRVTAEGISELLKTCPSGNITR